MTPSRDADRLVRQYHDETKHHFQRSARSLGYLDWATQPDPFRSFDGAPVIDLVPALKALSSTGDAPFVDGYDDLWAGRGSGARVEPGLTAVSAFLRFSLGLSAWKQAGGSRWALRVNPSSGNLHPTEGYVLVGPGVVDPDRAATCHYAPDQHALHRRGMFDRDAWRRLLAPLPDGAFFAGISSIHWREAWKYGERAFRYCQHDVGHAIAAMRIAAALIGWRLVLLPAWPADAVAAALGLDRDEDFAGAEREEPACLAAVIPGPPAANRRPDARDQGDERLHRPDALDVFRSATWTGRANRLSGDHVAWEWIDTVATASRQSGPLAADPMTDPPARAASAWTTPRAVAPAARLILQRRSAVAMDGWSALALDRFVAILSRLLPGRHAPWDALWWIAHVHLVLFVHRVTGLDPGLYAFVRRPEALPQLQAAFHDDFAWSHPPQVPSGLPLYLLAPLDARPIARQLSCGQDIAADGFFSLGMLAEFAAALDRRGPSFYRNLFWEAGVIGQVLYLEAEAAGARGTGIGCFFDDGVHDLLGLHGHAWQSLYHFTVGMPSEDRRLQTRPGYTWE